MQWQGSFDVPGQLAIARRVIASWLQQHPVEVHPLEVRDLCSGLAFCAQPTAHVDFTEMSNLMQCWQLIA